MEFLPFSVFSSSYSIVQCCSKPYSKYLTDLGWLLRWYFKTVVQFCVWEESNRFPGLTVRPSSAKEIRIHIIYTNGTIMHLAEYCSQ
jgi:hypothetical protein